MFKYRAILLLLVLQIPIGGTYLVFKHRQFNIRKEIKRQIKWGASEDDLVLLKIPRELEEKPNKQFKRIHSREFRFEGEMYDIVRQEARGDTTWYWCIWDEEETALFAGLDEALNRALGADPVNREAGNQLDRFLKNLVLCRFSQVNISLLQPAGNPPAFSFHLTLSTRYIPPPTPPPETAA
jgi:hypothetical protein